MHPSRSEAIERKSVGSPWSNFSPRGLSFQLRPQFRAIRERVRQRSDRSANAELDCGFRSTGQRVQPAMPSLTARFRLSPGQMHHRSHRISLPPSGAFRTGPRRTGVGTPQRTLRDARSPSP
jgi:hypothetical protein